MVVMEVLPCSEVQYVGERSPGTKPAEDIVEEPTLVQVDSSRQRTGDKIPCTIRDSKRILLDVDYAQKISGDDLSDDTNGEGDTLLELNCAPQKFIEPLHGIYDVGKTLQKLNGSQRWQGHERLLTNNCQGVANFLKTGSQLAGHSLSNGTSEEEAALLKSEEIHKEEVDRLKRIKLLPFSDSRHNEQSNCLEKEQGVLTTNSLCNADDCVVYTEEAHTDEISNNNQRESEVAQPNSESILSEASDSHVEEDGQPIIPHEPSDLAFRTDLGQGNLCAQWKNNNLFSSSNISLPIVQLEAEVQNCNQEGTSSLLGDIDPEQNRTVALWVKWRGKWQTGIRCSRADCPLSTLRAKPTHERKKYFVVFFPHTRTYSWADMLLVHSIDELPEPLASGDHLSWRALVKDLMIPRRYIMQKLAVAMLNISDQLHTEAVIENARKPTTWKEFAMEASRCKCYSDLGRMLLKLQNMILPGYVSHDWLENSFDSWVSRCQSAGSAESVEILTEELMESVLWNEVDALWDAPVQPELGSEWKTWKQESIKWFFASHPTASDGDAEQSNFDNLLGVGPQVSRKRPKLEIRRAEMHSSQTVTGGHGVHSQVNSVDTDSEHFNYQTIVKPTNTLEHRKVEALTGVAAVPDSGTVADRWDEIIVEVGDEKLIINPEEMGTSADGGSGRTPVTTAHHESDAMKKYRQCLAFIEAKGRQCGRWANDGDSYCCVHLNSRSVGNLHQGEQTLPLEAPMCKGTTTHGMKCKHRARYGSPFCKKHRLQGNHDLMHTDDHWTSVNKLKRKHGEGKVLEIFPSSNTLGIKEVGLVGEAQSSVKENLIPIAVGETLDERNCLMKKYELYDALPTPLKGSSPDLQLCIGYCRQNNDNQCPENAKRHTLYCEKHLPNFLKRARNGKSRPISKDVFINLLRNCSSRKEKLFLHQACELLYGFMKSSSSRQKSVSKADNMGMILSEASRDQNIGDYLLKLVSSEKEKIRRLWGFGADKDKQISHSEAKAVPVLEVHEKDHDPDVTLKCKICAKEFSDDQALGDHWTEIHKKEARWLFRGYACAICTNSFTNRKVLEIHVKERHGLQFLENSVLFRCMSCNSHFVHPEQLWQHVLSFHFMEFRLPNFTQQPNQLLGPSAQPKIESGSKLGPSNGVSENDDGSQRFICRFCGLRFDLLPDLGRHHQVAHMRPNSISHFPPKGVNRHLKRSRHCHPRYKKNFGASFRIKSPANFSMQKHFHSSNSVISGRTSLETQASETVGLGKLSESRCSDVAETLFSKIQKTKSRPSNLEILSVARSACCRISLHAALEVKYGILPEQLYLKAAKLCSELNIKVDWHLEDFICPKGCKPLKYPHSLDPLVPLPDGFVESTVDPVNDGKWEMDECHYILDSKHLNWESVPKAIILCEDVSFGREPVPVACVLDKDLKDSHDINSTEISCCQKLGFSMPWQGFTYVTERLLDPSLGLEIKNSLLGCACPRLKCYPESCDHVYLFDNDYENAEDIHGKPMHGRFPYDERGQIVLEEGYLVYECNSMCNCSRTCQNRVLQNGVQIKLEVFRTEKKGWAVRAGEALSRGTFVCEFIGEVLSDLEATKRGKRHDDDGHNYLYDIGAHIDDMNGLTEGTVPYVIDATKYGNVSRFINHSCSPNLVNYQVLVESMDCQLAHIGLYASRDIAKGEELAYDYHYKLLSGEGSPCHCGASNCRGRLY